jgi:hypothetical protein
LTSTPAQKTKSFSTYKEHKMLGIFAQHASDGESEGGKRRLLEEWLADGGRREQSGAFADLGMAV